MFFSVIVCTHNNESIISETLNAIRLNDFKDYELIVVDDGSTDNTVIKAKPLSDQIVKLKKNKGPSYARNAGAKLAKAKWLVFIDSDGIISSNQLAKMYQATIDTPQCLGIATDTSIEPKNKGFLSQYQASQDNYYIKECFRNSTPGKWIFITTRCGSIKKDIFLMLNGFDERFFIPSCEDFDISVRIQKNKLGYFYFLSGSDVNHYWEPSIIGLCKRLYRNSFLFTRYLANSTIAGKAIATKTRGYANLIGFLSLAFIAGTYINCNSCYVGLSLFFIMLYLQRNFLKFIRPNGVVFTISVCTLLLLLTVPITVGALSGKLPGKRHKYWHG